MIRRLQRAGTPKASRLCFGRYIPGRVLVRDFLRSGLELDLPEAAAVGDHVRPARTVGNGSSWREGPGKQPLCRWMAFAPPGSGVCRLRDGATSAGCRRGCEADFEDTDAKPGAACGARAVQGCGDVTRLLIERGADVNAMQTAGYRPLHQAAVAGREDLVRILLDAGADKAARCDRGKTPAEYARNAA